MQRVHGKCKTEVCPKLDMGGRHCMAHRGGCACQAERFRRLDVGTGYCRAHGGLRICQTEGCDKSALKGDHCIAR